MVSTGNKICPAFPTSERGLAYDPVSNTFYSGSWNDWVIYHFDAEGTILDSVDVGLDVSGLALNPMTGSLFVMTNADTGFDVYKLDVNDGYNLLGAFNIAGLGDFEQAGLEIDCDGTLWAVNQITQEVIAATSGESEVCDWADIPWLTETPASGTVAASGEEDVTLTFDSTGLAPGTYEAHLRVLEDTPYGVPAVPVTLIVVEGSDLAVSLAGAPDPVFTSELLTYTVTVDNLGTSAAAGVEVEMTLPSDVELVEVSGACTALPCDLGSLAGGGQATFEVIVRVGPMAASPLVAGVEVTSTTADPDLENNTATLETEVNYKLYLPLILKAGGG
jgi:uncharacterized repeat protein (TIGR01451 family)